MKNLYYCTFVPGMQGVIAAVVRQRLGDVSIEKLLEGAVLFETACSYDRLNFFCFNNIFAVIDVFEKRDISVPVISTTFSLRTERARKVISENNKKIKTFRLVCSVENKPASIDENLRHDIESFIAHNSTLAVDRRKPDTEFWFLSRREGSTFFMKRLTRSVEKKLRPGELSPQLAWLLCCMGELKPGETVLDPFCGYGSIPEAALKHFHIGKFLASDSDSGCVKISRSKQSLKSERCEIRAADIFSIPDFVSAGGVDAIITDPPWGMYKETQIPLTEFYEKTLAVFSKLLKKGGRAVILSAAREELESAAVKIKELSIAQTISVLVSGKKASVYRIVCI